MDVPSTYSIARSDSDVVAGYRNHALPRRIANAAIPNNLRLHPANKYYRL
jgi:hypothetical protein